MQRLFIILKLQVFHILSEKNSTNSDAYVISKEAEKSTGFQQYINQTNNQKI